MSKTIEEILTTEDDLISALKYCCDLHDRLHQKINRVRKREEHRKKILVAARTAIRISRKARGVINCGLEKMNIT